MILTPILHVLETLDERHMYLDFLRVCVYTDRCGVISMLGQRQKPFKTKSN